MDNWSEIKSKILFSYMGCDWTSVRVSDTSIDRLNEVLNEVVILNQIEDTILSFEIDNVNIYFYTKSDQHFDFDPKEIVSPKQWTSVLTFFKRLSTNLKAEIFFRPEDSNYDSKESILVQISGNTVVYNFVIKADYDDN